MEINSPFTIMTYKAHDNSESGQQGPRWKKAAREDLPTEGEPYVKARKINKTYETKEKPIKEDKKKIKC